MTTFSRAVSPSIRLPATASSSTTNVCAIAAITPARPCHVNQRRQLSRAARARRARSPSRSRRRRRCAPARARARPRTSRGVRGRAGRGRAGARRSARESRRAEERPDRLRLADERLRDRRVVEQDDPPVAAGDLPRARPRSPPPPASSPRTPRAAAARRSRAARRRGSRRRSPSRPTTPTSRPSTSWIAYSRWSTRTPASSSTAHHLLAPVRVVVVVAEHGEHRQLERPARIREHGRLLRLAVGRQVAGEQHEVRLRRWTSANACAMCSRNGSEQWMSPAAAMRIVSVIQRHVPRRGFHKREPGV